MTARHLVLVEVVTLTFRPEPRLLKTLKNTGATESETESKGETEKEDQHNTMKTSGTVHKLRMTNYLVL